MRAQASFKGAFPGSRQTALAAVFVTALAVVPEVHADAVGDFYAGKTVRVVIGYPAGGTYDVSCRLVAQFLGRRIPGHPTLVPQNMPGAGSFAAAGYLANAAGQDGSVLGCVSQTLALDSAIAGPNAKNALDARNLHYIGRVATSIEFGLTAPDSRIKTFDDARTQTVNVGATGVATSANLLPASLNKYADAKFKLVRGYQGVPEILIAAERGEVDMAGAVSFQLLLSTHPDWLLAHKAHFLYQSSLKRHEVLPDVPTLEELATTNEGRIAMRALASTGDIGRSILTTPNVPPERLAALRRGFDAMVDDADFLAASKQRNIMVDPARGEEMDKIVQETMQLDRPVLDQLAVLVAE